MRYNLFITIALAFLILVPGCRSGSKELVPLSELSRMPSDSLTREQVELRGKVWDVFTENVTVKNNQLVFDMTMKEFIRMGLPGEYYQELVKSLDEPNRYFRENGIDTVEEIWELSNKNYREHRDEWFDSPFEL